ECPVTDVTRDQHADAARQHCARYGVGDVTGGKPAVRTRIQNRRRVPFLDAGGPLVVKGVGGLAVNFDEAKVALHDIAVGEIHAAARHENNVGAVGARRRAGVVKGAIEALTARIPVVPSAEIERELTEGRPHAAVEVDFRRGVIGEIDAFAGDAGVPLPLRIEGVTQLESALDRWLVPRLRDAPEIIVIHQGRRDGDIPGRWRWWWWRWRRLFSHVGGQRRGGQNSHNEER